jgi:putative nucleotidyltransferase with HDIG domain
LRLTDFNLTQFSPTGKWVFALRTPKYSRIRSSCPLTYSGPAVLIQKVGPCHVLPVHFPDISGSMNSLKVKILFLTTSIMVAAIAIITWHNLKTQKVIADQLVGRSNRVLGETIRNSIITNMALGHGAEASNILTAISREPAISAARIFDESGRILSSASPDEIGDMIPSSDYLAYRAGRYSFTEEDETGEFHITFVPIYNAPACYRCHNQADKILGVLTVRLSLNDLGSFRNREREATFGFWTAMLAVLILSISAFILLYVEVPIRKMIGAMNHIEQGDFGKVNVEVRSSDEMALLATKFNLMVQRLLELIQTTVRHEREIAVSQEKLAHHDEIRNMNITLEERLGEIESLNITLEERIEEIEEANYKIFDLASDLESKNTTLKQAVSRLSALYEMGLAINSTMDLDRLFHLLLRRTVDTLEARIGYILLLTEDGKTLTLAGATGISDHPGKDSRIPLQPGGVSFWVIHNRGPLLLRDIDQSVEFNRESRLGFDRKTVICAPLIIKEEIIGTITMANRLDESPFNSEDLELLSTIAAQASVAINNARLYEEQQTIYLSTVQALVSTIEANDAYTRGHSERVTRYSLALARELNLNQESMRKLERAAILHDIGKIGIDVALLHKEGDLSAEELGILQQHPTIGSRILEPIRFLQGVGEIIQQHHERYDGNGYPLGLQGEKILIEARILAVVDTYDAMTSDRPYRQARPPEIAVAEIEHQAGAQFDPAVARTFIRMCSEEVLSPGR